MEHLERRVLVERQVSAFAGVALPGLEEARESVQAWLYDTSVAEPADPEKLDLLIALGLRDE